MKSNYRDCLAFVLQWEGGYSDHPADPGGATMKGITQHTYSQWLGRPASKSELKAIPQDHVEAIYKRDYWDAVKGDDLPAGLDLVAFDAAVNSGVSRGAKWLQRALGVKDDGRIGAVSLAATGRKPAADVIEDACDIRLAFLKGLRTWKDFGRGWERRVTDLRQTALDMAKIKHEEIQPAPSGLFAALIAAVVALLKAIFGAKK